jgi:hypothetical protein
MNDTAPIIIFCYRRKIDKLINSLKKNKEAPYSNLFIFSDGYKSNEDKKDVYDARKFIKKIKGFKSIKIFYSNTNKGLAISIINGVTSVVNDFGKAIVLEDDLVVSEYFLNFMNRALNFYKDNKDIWSISGYSPPLLYLKDYKKEVYLSLRSSSWGWATWIDRWNKTDWVIKDFYNLRKDKDKIRKFNQGGNDMFRMLELQHLGKIDSWAIRWCYSQFLNSTYSVVPKISMVQNIGFNDKFSTHTKGNDFKWRVNLAKGKISNFEVSLNYEIIHNFKKFFDNSFYTRIGYFLKKWHGYKIIKDILKIRLKKIFFH